MGLVKQLLTMLSSLTSFCQFPSRDAIQHPMFRYSFLNNLAPSNSKTLSSISDSKFIPTLQMCPHLEVLGIFHLPSIYQCRILLLIQLLQPFFSGL